VGYGDVKIRDLSRRFTEWTPPIGALGGPPAHALYTDLVQYAGLQLFRDSRGRPWVVLRDGAERRAFLVPSPELRSALDRFRMHRNLAPVPESHITDFVRVVQARVSDPDVAIPILRSPVVEPVSLPEWRPIAPPASSEPVGAPDEPEGRPVMPPPVADFEAPESPPSIDPSEPPEPPPPVLEPSFPLGPVPPVSMPPSPPEPRLPTSEPVIPPPEVPGSPIDLSVSGARRFPSTENAGLARYVSVLQTLVQDGGWLGTTEELSNLMQDEPLAMFDSIHRYRSELERRNILITSVEVEDGFRWLAVDRARTLHRVQGPPPDYRALPPR